MKIRCPICHTELDVAEDFPTRPFCSPRCKRLDLQNWLDGNYRLPRELLPEDLDALPADEREEALAALYGNSKQQVN